MSAPAEEPDPNLGKVFGHCRLERKLGEGGMGKVYLATHTTLNKMVAVKVLRAELSADMYAAERFLREARSAARIDHPSVVQVYDIGQADGTFYIVMQFVEGATLESAVRKSGTVPAAEAIRIMKSVCEGVREAHQNGIIHRDIKPDNILLGKDGSVKLADFGLARAVEGDPNLSSTGRFFGTPHFMSPEQALGENVDSRSDIFSLGATFYRIVTGRYPFQATTAMGVVMKLTHEMPPPAREVNPSLPLALSDLIASMMAKKPSERIRSVDEVVRRLEAVLAQLQGAPPAWAGASGKTSRIPPRGSAAHPWRRAGHRRQIRGAVLGITALVLAACLVLHRYGLLPLPFGLRVFATSGKEVEPSAVEAVAATKAAATQAAGEMPPAPGDEPEDPPGPEEDHETSPPPPPDEPDPGPRPPAGEERAALERRVGEFLRDMKDSPEQLGRYLDPEARTERSVRQLRRMCALLLEGRPPEAPSLGLGRVSIEEHGRAAGVEVLGLGRPAHLRWLKRRGEWYLSPPRRR